MSNSRRDNVFPEQKMPGSDKGQAPGKSSRLVRNSQKWDSLKERIYGMYMVEDRTLQDTMRAITERYGFKASERKWKDKLKEWRFEKNISATDLSIIVAKAEKRAREEGKQTIFFHGNSEITRERIEQFKRRKTTKVIEAGSPSPETPRNITYHTPCPDSPKAFLQEPPNQSRISTETTEFISPGPLFPWKENGLGLEKYEGRATLSTVFETSLEDRSNTEEIFKEPPSQAYSMIETLGHGSSHVPYQGTLGGAHRALEQEPIGHNMFDPEGSTIDCVSELGVVPGSSVSNVSHLGKQLDNLSIDLSTHLSLPVSAMGQNRKLRLEIQPTGETIEEMVIESVEHPIEELCQSQVGDGTESVQGTTCSSQSDDSFSENGASFMSEDGSRTSVTSETGRPDFEAVVKEALALRAKGKPLDSILLDLGCAVNEICSEFCQNLWRLCFLFEKKGLLEEASTAFDLIQAGYTRVFGFSSIETMRCILHKARILRKRQEHGGSESAYRQAIEVLKSLGKAKYQLKCQIFLSDYLRNLGKKSEALYLLLETLIEHFHSTTTLAEKTKVIEVMGSMQRLHLKMDVDQNMVNVMASISRLQQLQTQLPGLYHQFNVWVEFVCLGSCYSEIGKLDMADLCFATAPPEPQPGRMQGKNPRLKIELARFCKDRSIHYRRRMEVVESNIQLKVAFDHLLSVGTEDEYDHCIGIILEQLLRTFEPPEAKIRKRGFNGEAAWMRARELLTDLESPEPQVVRKESSLEVKIWIRARDTFLKRVSYWEIPQQGRRGRPVLESKQGRASKSISSHGSSMISGSSTCSRFGVTYSTGSASSWVSNSGLMVP